MTLDNSENLPRTKLTAGVERALSSGLGYINSEFIISDFHSQRSV